MWFRFKHKYGKHYHDGIWFSYPDRIESDFRLDLLYEGIFNLASAVYMPRPRLGQREILAQELRPSRHTGDGVMTKFAQVRQKLLPVPTNRGITKQHIVVTEGEGDTAVILVEGDFTIDVAEQDMPTYWAEVGEGIKVAAKFGDDLGNWSDELVDTYIQAGLPDPEPVPEPTPEPVQLPKPEALGERVILNQVESDARPVQMRRRKK